MGGREGPPRFAYGFGFYLFLLRQGHAGPGLRLRRQADGPLRREVRCATARPVVVLVCMSLSTWDGLHFDQFEGHVGQSGDGAQRCGIRTDVGGHVCRVCVRGTFA